MHLGVRQALFVPLYAGSKQSSLNASNVIGSYSNSSLLLKPNDYGCKNRPLALQGPFVHINLPTVT